MRRGRGQQPWQSGALRRACDRAVRAIHPLIDRWLVLVPQSVYIHAANEWHLPDDEAREGVEVVAEEVRALVGALLADVGAAEVQRRAQAAQRQVHVRQQALLEALHGRRCLAVRAVQLPCACIVVVKRVQ